MEKRKLDPFGNGVHGGVQEIRTCRIKGFPPGLSLR